MSFRFKWREDHRLLCVWRREHSEKNWSCLDPLVKKKKKKQRIDLNHFRMSPGQISMSGRNQFLFLLRIIPSLPLILFRRRYRIARYSSKFGCFFLLVSKSIIFLTSYDQIRISTRHRERETATDEKGETLLYRAKIDTLPTLQKKKKNKKEKRARARARARERAQR